MEPVALHAAEPLAKPPIPAGPLVRRLLVLAFLAPAIVLAAQSLTEMETPEGAPAASVLALGFAALWALLALLPPGRRLALDVGRVLLARFTFLPLLLLALLAAVLSAGGVGSVALLQLAAWAALLASASLAHLAAHDRPRMRRQLLLLGVNAVLLVGVDFAIRVFVLPHKSHNNVFIEHDPGLGWKMRPSVSMVHEADDFTALETTNKLGFRGRDLPFEKPPGTLRIVILGDSHGEAYTVDDDKTWWAELERMLGSLGKVEVISLGVGGYSTDQELLSYLDYGRRFQPDLVLLQMCANDLEYNVLDHYWRGKKPMFVRHGEQLVLTGVPVPNLRNTGLLPAGLLRVSAIAVLAESVMRGAAIDRDVEVVADREEAWKVTRLLVRDLIELVRGDGSRIALLDASSNNKRFDPQVRAFAAEFGVPYLELDAAYTDDFKSYWVGGHWNEKGQLAAARVLAPQIAALLQDSAKAPMEASAKR